MPRSMPLVDELLPPLDGRPLNRREWSEQRAVKLALVMVVVAWHQSEFLPQHRPIRGGHDDDFAWLHEHLEPLARVSLTVRRLRQVFDQELHGWEWFRPERVRRNLKRLAHDAVLLGSVMAARSTASPRRTRG
jgi:hypothetical protein